MSRTVSWDFFLKPVPQKTSDKQKGTFTAAGNLGNKYKVHEWSKS